mgnify:CR=1 FL=1
METIIWDGGLSVEVDEIDDDHRKLVDLFNLLSDAVEEGESIDYIDALLEELITCTAWHFRHEERLMLKYEYEAFEAHKEEHADLIDSARKLQRRFREDNKQLQDEDIEYLSQWLTEHIVGNDMKLGFYLMNEM